MRHDLGEHRYIAIAPSFSTSAEPLSPLLRSPAQRLKPLALPIICAISQEIDRKPPTFHYLSDLLGNTQLNF
jgi:hypothetical protein